jgi:hypothetical protein
VALSAISPSPVDITAKKYVTHQGNALLLQTYMKLMKKIVNLLLWAVEKDVEHYVKNVIIVVNKLVIPRK